MPKKKPALVILLSTYFKIANYTMPGSKESVWVLKCTAVSRIDKNFEQFSFQVKQLWRELHVNKSLLKVFKRM